MIMTMIYDYDYDIWLWYDIMNGAGVRYQEGQETFSFLQYLKTLSGAHPASYSIRI